MEQPMGTCGALGAGAPDWRATMSSFFGLDGVFDAYGLLVNCAQVLHAAFLSAKCCRNDGFFSAMVA